METYSTVITRTGFCQSCYDNQQPISGQKFKVVGSRGAHVYTLDFNPRFSGFTPHLYGLRKVIGQNVVFDSICCMEGCGIIRIANNDLQCWEFIERDSRWIRGMMEIKDWNALVQKYKRDMDYFL